MMLSDLVSRSNVLSLLIAATAVGYAIWSSSSLLPPPVPHEKTSRPKYYIPNDELLDRLEHVQEAFARAGYTLVTNANYSEDWHTMWTFHNPFWQREKSVDLPATMLQLKSHQKVNHVPGASRFTSKVDLAKHTADLAFVPKSFLLPEQHAKFMEYQSLHPDVTWVRKSKSHRGVRIVDPKDPALAKEDVKESVVQQFIRPYLIDKSSSPMTFLPCLDLCFSRLWDMGVYIAITSVNPLRVYYFDNILVRACREDFVEDLEKAPRDAYVVDDDYMPPWSLPTFRPYYTWGMSTLNVLRAFFHSQGIVFDDVFHQMRANILELVGSYVQKLERAATRFPHGQSSFYSLYRVDFLLDRNLTPWITEVNQSPNLSSHHFADLATMFQRIAYSLLSLVGLTPGGLHHPSSSDQDLEILFHANDIDIGYSICQECNQDCYASPKCALCRPCRTPIQSEYLKALISEQRSRLGFIPLYPLRNSSFSSMRHLSVTGENNVLLQNFVLMKCEQDTTWC